MHEGLPVKLNLRNRFAIAEDWCPWCEFKLELVLHYFVTCPHSVEVWKLHDQRFADWSNFAGPIWSQWMHLWDSINQRTNRLDYLARIAFTLWQIWLAKNARIFEARVTTPQEIYATASRLSEEFRIHDLPISLPQFTFIHMFLFGKPPSLLLDCPYWTLFCFSSKKISTILAQKKILISYFLSFLRS